MKFAAFIHCVTPWIALASSGDVCVGALAFVTIAPFFIGAGLLVAYREGQFSQRKEYSK